MIRIIFRKTYRKIVQKLAISKYFDKKKEIVSIRKTGNILQINLKVSGKLEQRSRIDGEEYSTQLPIFDLKLKLSKRHGTVLCGIEGTSYRCKMWMFPFMVEPSSLGTSIQVQTRF